MELSVPSEVPRWAPEMATRPLRSPSASAYLPAINVVMFT